MEEQHFGEAIHGAFGAQSADLDGKLIRPALCNLVDEISLQERGIRGICPVDTESSIHMPSSGQSYCQTFGSKPFDIREMLNNPQLGDVYQCFFVLVEGRWGVY